MGKYLGMGIVTEVLVDKDEAVKALYTEDAALRFLNERYNPTGLYDFTFNERSGNYAFTLKREIMRREWIPALKTFYSIRYPDWKDETNVISELERLNDPDQWLGKDMIYGHQNYYHTMFYYDFTRHDFGRHIMAHVDTVSLSIDGKIIMECYAGVMDFFTRLVREKLSAFQLRDAFKVYLTE